MKFCKVVDIIVLTHILKRFQSSNDVIESDLIIPGPLSLCQKLKKNHEKYMHLRY